VGVAIATALMPPLAVIGFGIATGNGTILSGSLLLFLTNAVTISLTAALMARIYGFGSHLSPSHTGWQVALFVVALGILSVPLGAALRQIAFETVAQRQVRDTLRTHFPQEARIGQVEVDFASSPIRVRAIMLTPRLYPHADRNLATDLQQRMAQPVDIHVDQVRISPDSGAAEAAQVARAADAGAAASAAQRAAADLALIAGTEQSAVRMDPALRRLTASAAPLPGLGLAGYRALEARAGAALPGWTIALSPPADAGLPAIAIRAGVVDVAALDVAGWASARLGRTITVAGGTSAQREAIAEGVAARGGRAEAGEAGGPLRMEWKPSDGPVEDG
jgi:hypothetical protein